MSADRNSESVIAAKEEAVELYSRVHKPLVEKDNLVQCNDCHRQENSVLDLSRLTKDQDKLDQYQNNVISEFFSRYKKDDQKIKIINLLR